MPKGALNAVGALILGMQLFTANASEITGSFSGTITTTASMPGTIDGIAGSSLLGSSVTGTFSYDTANLDQVDQSPTWISYHGPSISINVQIGANSFSATGSAIPGGGVFLRPLFFDQFDVWAIGPSSYYLGVDVNGPSSTLYSDPYNLSSASFANLPGAFFIQDVGAGGSGYFWSFAIENVSVNSALPVPEPESYAMLLAGLGLLGFIARRRKQKETAAA